MITDFGELPRVGVPHGGHGPRDRVSRRPRPGRGTLATRSFRTLKWMTTKGVRFLPIYGRQAFKVNGRFKFSQGC